MKVLKTSKVTAIILDHVKRVKMTKTGTDFYIEFIIEVNYNITIHIGDKEHESGIIFNQVLRFMSNKETLLTL